MQLTELDTYAVSRALVGLDWQDLTINPLLRDMLSNIGPKDGHHLLRFLGPDAAQQVVAINPESDPPNGLASIDDVDIPALPDEAQLSDQALQAAEIAAPFADDFMRWSIMRTPMTPPAMLWAGIMWLLGTVVARRCVINIYKPIAPNLYVMWVAETSVFRKSTAMDTLSDLMQASLPHLLLPQDMTPEAFMSALSGKQPSNYEHLLPHQKTIVNKGQLFAAQRGILIDEASSMLGAKKKDYMQGQEELLLQGFDSSSKPLRRWTSSEGWIEVRDLCLSILGATTPAAFVRNTNVEAWETGQMARYALIYPEKRLPYSLPVLSHDELRPPRDLINRLVTLSRLLPQPPDLLTLHSEEPPVREVLNASITKEAMAAYQSYAKTLTYDLLDDNLDRRLFGNYSRLPELAMKVALSLATINWADNGAKGSPQIGLGEWSRAQQTTELWRASLHRLIKCIDIGKDAHNENRVLSHLVKYSDGETLRELTRRTGLDRKAVQESLDSLMQAGMVRQDSRKNTRGPQAVIYVAC